MASLAWKDYLTTTEKKTATTWVRKFVEMILRDGELQAGMTSAPEKQAQWRMLTMLQVRALLNDFIRANLTTRIGEYQMVDYLHELHGVHDGLPKDILLYFCMAVKDDYQDLSDHLWTTMMERWYGQYYYPREFHEWRVRDE